MIEATDFLENKIEVGDPVIFTELNYRNFMRGEIIRITPKMCVISYRKSGRESLSECKQFHDQVIKIMGE